MTSPVDRLPPPARERRQRLTGIALMCGAVACFAALDATAKYLNTQMDTLQVVWARFTTAFLLAPILANPLARPKLLISGRPLLQLGRATLLFVTTVLNFLALRYLQLDEALAIMFSTPFIITILSGPALGEWVGWRRWFAVGVGFLGVIVVTRPTAGGMHPAALLSVAGAVSYAFYSIATRVLSRTDSSETTLLYSNLVGALIMLPVVPFVWTTPSEPLLIGLMIVMGVFGTLGHYLLIIAHRLAPAAVLAPFIYTQLVWAMALGFMIFANVPNHWTLAGAAIVVASGLYILHRERVRGRR